MSTRLDWVLDLYTHGKFDEETLEAVSRRLHRRRDAIKEQLATLEAPLRVDFSVNRERLRAFVGDMERWMHEGDVVRRKTLLREVYQAIGLCRRQAASPGRARSSSPPTWTR